MAALHIWRAPSATLSSQVVTLAATQGLPESVIRALAPLREALTRRGTVMPVVGAGMSVPIGPQGAGPRLPTWRGLLEELIARVPGHERAELAKLLASDQPTLVASELVQYVGRSVISTYIQQRFAEPSFARPSVYDALVALPIDHFLTTNYDPFLRDAWIAHHGVPTMVITPRDLGALRSMRVDAQPFVLMLHGDASRPSTSVLSTEDFAQLQFGAIGYSQALASLALQRRLLFLGYSIHDPDFRAILREVRTHGRDGDALPHWLVGTEIDGPARRYLAAHGVEAIEIARHPPTGNELELVLRILAITSEAEVTAAHLPMARAPTCFVSYSWDSPVHEAWVRELTDRLRYSGVEARLDKYELKLGQDVSLFMETSVRTADFVLLVCTPAFAAKADAGQGGVGYEKQIVTGEMLNGAPPEKFVPLLRVGDPARALPSYLKSKLFVDFRTDDRFQQSFSELLAHLFKDPLYKAPPIGQRPR